jgi:hypothetical protein
LPFNRRGQLFHKIAIFKKLKLNLNFLILKNIKIKIGIFKRKKAIAFFKNMKDLFHRIFAELLQMKLFSIGKNPGFK